MKTVSHWMQKRHEAKVLLTFALAGASAQLRFTPMLTTLSTSHIQRSVLRCPSGLYTMSLFVYCDTQIPTLVPYRTQPTTVLLTFAFHLFGTPIQDTDNCSVQKYDQTRIMSIFYLIIFHFSFKQSFRGVFHTLAHCKLQTIKNISSAETSE